MAAGASGGPDARRRSRLDAQLAAQRIALAPLVFQAARGLRDLGILEALRHAHDGLTREEVAQRLDVASYGVTVLLERDWPPASCEPRRSLLPDRGGAVLPRR